MYSNLPTQALYGALLASVMVLSPSLAIAQTNNSSSVNPLQDFKTKDNYDPFSNNSTGGVTPGFFELIHRATQGFEAGKSATEQGQDLDDATKEFRNLQQKRLNPNQESSVTPQATTPTPTPSTGVAQ